MPGQSMWDLWWTKWYCDRFTSCTSVSPCQYHSTNSPYASSSRFYYYTGERAKPGTIPISNATAVMGQHWIEEYFRFSPWIFNGLSRGSESSRIVTPCLGLHFLTCCYCVGRFSQINPEDQRLKTCDDLVAKRIFRPPRKGGPVLTGAVQGPWHEIIYSFCSVQCNIRRHVQDDGAKLCFKRDEVFQTCWSCASSLLWHKWQSDVRNPNQTTRHILTF